RSTLAISATVPATTERGANERDELPGVSDPFLRLLNFGRKGRTHLRLLGGGDRAGDRAHVAAPAAEGDCAAAGLADRHVVISGVAARTSVTVMQQKTRRQRPAG